MDSEWGNIISFVPQNVYLLNDSIQNNVAFDIPEKMQMMKKRNAHWKRHS